jgi:hypothetical protein
MIAPGIFPGPYGRDGVASFRIGEHLPKACEIGIERRIVLVAFVKIAARRIRLPDFDECMRNWAFVFVHHPARHDDSLANRLARVLAREIKTDFDKVFRKGWACQF